MKAYQLKVSMKGLKPPVWRRVIVPAGYSFSQLSVILIGAMGWSGYHLTGHAFSTLGIEFTEMDGEDFDPLWGTETLEASEYVIDDYLEQVRSYTFTYDYGDDWEHLVQIEKVLEDYEKNYPQVVKYKGNLPLEDCGGLWGYQKLKEHLADPEDPEHEDAMEWSGGSADIEYDLEGANEFLAGMYLKDRKAKPKTQGELLEALYGGKTGFNRISVKHGNVFQGQRPKDTEVNRLKQMFMDALQKEVDKHTLTPEDGIRELTMMLLYLTRFREVKADADRAWKSYDHATLDQLSEAGYLDPGSRQAKSVVITEEGKAFARKLLKDYNISDWK